MLLHIVLLLFLTPWSRLFKPRWIIRFSLSVDYESKSHSNTSHFLQTVLSRDSLASSCDWSDVFVWAPQPNPSWCASWCQTGEVYLRWLDCYNRGQSQRLGASQGQRNGQKEDRKTEIELYAKQSRGNDTRRQKWLAKHLKDLKPLCHYTYIPEQRARIGEKEIKRHADRQRYCRETELVPKPSINQHWSMLGGPFPSRWQTWRSFSGQIPVSHSKLLGKSTLHLLPVISRQRYGAGEHVLHQYWPRSVCH